MPVLGTKSKGKTFNGIKIKGTVHSFFSLFCFFGVVLQLSGYCFNGLVNGQFVTTKDKQM